MREIYGRAVLSTLREIVRPDHTALVVVDVQNDFVHPDGLAGRGSALASIPPLLASLRVLVAQAREARIPVIFVQNTTYPDTHTAAAGDLARRARLCANAVLSCQVGTWGREFVAEVQPEPQDIVVSKDCNCAFTGTNLDMILRAGRVQTIVVTGVATHACVLATALSGMHLGYYVVVPADCVAASSSEQHQAGLLVAASNLQDPSVVSSTEIMAAWGDPAAD